MQLPDRQLEEVSDGLESCRRELEGNEG
jgi:hypothetical protein